jgi:NAD(P)H-hydrate epimerase
VLAVCGSADMPGAAVLVARAAQRAGAGLVCVGWTAPSLRTMMPVASPESILMDLSEPGARDAKLRAAAWHALAIGPGLGTDEPARRLVHDVYECIDVASVVDADGLTCLADELSRPARRAGALVLTPHPGEAARLLRREIPRDEPGRIESAREISAGSGAICCLKGHRTVVADRDRVYVNDTGNPGMATAGAGDVLTGIVAAYLAYHTVRQDEDGWSAFDAAASAVYVHGLAADLAAQCLGTRGLVASDLIDFLPAAQMHAAASAERVS